MNKLGQHGTTYRNGHWLTSCLKMKRPFDQMQGGPALIAATLLLGPCRCVVLPGPEMASNTFPWKIMRTQVCPSPVTFYRWILILEFSSDADWTGYLNIFCLSSWDFLWRKYPAISTLSPLAHCHLSAPVLFLLSWLVLPPAPVTLRVVTLNLHTKLPRLGTWVFLKCWMNTLTYYGPWLQ